MKQVVQNYKTGKIAVQEVPIPGVTTGHVLVENAFSLISAGTERMSVEFARKNMLAKAKSRPADFKKVVQLARKQGLISAFKTAMTRLETPAPLGYSCAGIAAGVGAGVTDIRKGDKVACAGVGYASHAEFVLIPKNLCALVPADVTLEHAAFTTLAAIALQGVRQAEIQVGHNVAVIGLGLLGQLTVQILKASGCRVAGIDLDKEKVGLARQGGADLVLLRRDNVVSAISEFTKGYGVDAVVITAATDSNDPFLLAPEIARDRACVVLVGVAKIDFPREPYYRKELSINLARSYGPGRYDPGYEEQGVDYPLGYVRWTEKRNMEAILQLMTARKLDVSPLISHRFKIDDVRKAYDLIVGRTKERSLGVLFAYGTAKHRDTRIVVTKAPALQSSQTQIGVGFIGVGNFARTSLLPHLKEKRILPVGIADVQGPLAKSVAGKYGYEYCTSDYHELLNDRKINAVFIATRHDMHARIIIESLEKGKHVFCEKPLCLNKEELSDVLKAREMRYAKSPTILMIGYNRRFAPLTEKVKDYIGTGTGPCMIHYRVNAGELPVNHWLLDPNQGGGRVVGEVCHFVDFASHIIGARLVSVFSRALSGSERIGEDNIVATLQYADGSVGTISYCAVGDKDFPKERVEIFGGEKVCVIDDFKKGIFSYQGKQREERMSQDKGHQREIREFINAVFTGVPPVPFRCLAETSLATFAINDSIRTGEPVAIPEIHLIEPAKK